MRGQEMRPKKVLFYRGIVYRGKNTPPKRGYSAAYKGYFYTICLYSCFIPHFPCFIPLSPGIFLYYMLIFYLYSLYTYLVYYT